MAHFIEELSRSEGACISKFSALEHLEIRPATFWGYAAPSFMDLPIILLPSLRSVKAHALMPSFAGPAYYETITSLYLDAWSCDSDSRHEFLHYGEACHFPDAITNCPNLKTLELTRFNPCRSLTLSLFGKMEACQNSLKSLTITRYIAGIPREDWRDACCFPTGLEKFTQLTNVDIDCHKFLWQISDGQAGVLPPSIEQVHVCDIVRADRIPFLLWLEYVTNASRAGNLPNLRQITYSFYQDENPRQYGYNNYLSMPKETIRDIETCGIQISRLFSPVEEAATHETVSDT
jgi:hypothetical protein